MSENVLAKLKSKSLWRYSDISAECMSETKWRFQIGRIPKEQQAVLLWITMYAKSSKQYEQMENTRQ